MKEAPAIPCANCELLQRQVETLQQFVDQQQQTLASLSEQIRTLQEKLAAASKNSRTSSKPPSSDLVKPPKPAPPPGQDKRQPGGQFGHPKHVRPAFLPAEITDFFDHVLSSCPSCGQDVESVPGPVRVVQQLDIRLIPVVLEEHRGHPVWCPQCLKRHYSPLPVAVEHGGLVGPRLTTLIAYLKGVCHASFSTVRRFLKDVAGVSLSRGQLAKVIAKVSAALAEPYEELLQRLPGEAILNVDETGHKDNATLMWTWCFRAELYTLFQIDPRRSADVLLDVLGEEFAGVLGCDHFSAYRRYMRCCDVRVQFCLAHLIRDVKFLTTLPGFEDMLYGERLRHGLKSLFAVIHQREQLPADEFARKLQEERERLLRVGTTMAPPTQHAQTMAKRLHKYGEAYFTFVTTPGVEPTNNLAEQAIRFVVIDRLVTQGTRSETGQRWSERIWTVIASCVQQGRSVLEYLGQAVQAHLGGEPAPSLLPSS